MCASQGILMEKVKYWIILLAGTHNTPPGTWGTKYAFKIDYNAHLIWKSAFGETHFDFQRLSNDKICLKEKCTKITLLPRRFSCF